MGYLCDYFYYTDTKDKAWSNNLLFSIFCCWLSCMCIKHTGETTIALCLVDSISSMVMVFLWFSLSRLLYGALNVMLWYLLFVARPLIYLTYDRLACEEAVIFCQNLLFSFEKNLLVLIECHSNCFGLAVFWGVF